MSTLDDSPIQRKRGRKPKHSLSEKHEIRRYREAGISIANLALMYRVTETTIHAYLREMRARLGKREELPADKKHLARQHLFICDKSSNIGS